MGLFYHFLLSIKDYSEVVAIEMLHNEVITFPQITIRIRASTFAIIFSLHNIETTPKQIDVYFLCLLCS